MIFSNKRPVLSRTPCGYTGHSSINERTRGETVLDLGNGTGGMLFFWRKMASRFTAWTIPPGNPVAREWLQAEGFNADLKYGDITEPFPYADAFFDALIPSRLSSRR